MEFPPGRCFNQAPPRGTAACPVAPSTPFPLAPGSQLARAQCEAHLEQGIITSVLQAPVSAWPPSMTGHSLPSDTAGLFLSSPGCSQVLSGTAGVFSLSPSLFHSTWLLALPSYTTRTLFLHDRPSGV